MLQTVREKFVELGDVETAARRKTKDEKPRAVYPLALEAVPLIDAIFAIEREINGKSP